MKYLSVQTFQCGISVSGAATFTGGATINLLALNGATTSSEASLFLGAHGTNEGGQLVLQKGTSNTYAAHLDNYADQFRLLYGTNTGSAGVALAVSLSTRQLILPAYTSTSSFSGTAVGYLAFDSAGNIITTASPAGAVTSIIAGTGVSVSSATGNVTISIGQSVATSAQVTFDSVITNNNGNGTNIKIGDDAWIGDVNAANTFRVTGAQNGANGYIIFGNSNFDALGRSGTGNLTYAGSTVWTAATLTDLSQLTNGPGYITSAALSGYVPTSRTLTINGTSYDLSANRSWTISTVDYTSRLQHQVKAGVAINKGQAVYVTSADGTNMIVGLASNASEATSSKTMGLLDATVTTNGFANVVTEGLLAGLDTTAAGAEGDPVWLGTGGNLIYGLANKPYAPAHLVFIGIVTRKNANNGEIFVKVQNGFELREIHDVDLITTVPVNGHILGYNGTLWVNKTIAGWLGYTPANASGTTNYISKFTGSTTLGNSLIYDDGSGVGIGTTSPSSKLSIVGPDNASGLGVLELVTSSTNLKLGGNFDYSWIQSHNSKPLRINELGNNVILNLGGGNTGIGTSSPSYKLDINGSFNTVTSGVSLTYNSGVLYHGPTYYQFPSGSYYYLYGRTGMGLIFGSNNAEVGRFDLSGNLGIGTTNPAFPLHVARSSGDSVIVADSGASSNSQFRFQEAGSLAAAITFVSSDDSLRFYNGGDRLTILSSGNVGIGTTSPAFPLTVYHATNAAATFQTSGTGTGAGNGFYVGHTSNISYVWNYNNFPLVLATNNTERIRVTEGGNVGIGTTAPAQQLHVTQNIALGLTGGSIGDTNNILFPTVNGTHTYAPNGIFYTKKGNWGGQIDIRTSYDWGYATDNAKISLNGAEGNGIVFYTGASALGSTERVRITSDGNVGIGTTSPNKRLSVNGQAIFYNAGITGTPNWANNSFEIQSSGGGTVALELHRAGNTSAQIYSDNGSLAFGTDSGVERMRITVSTGYVGIGTTSPTNRLQIGSIGSSGYGGNDLAIGNGTQVMAFYQSSTVSTWYTNTSFSLMPSGSGSVGNLGVGTDSPTQRVHVSGNLRVTGAFYDSNNQAGSAGQILKSTGTGTDWVSLSEITGVDGSGTANYVTKWSDADTVTNSLIYDNGTNVGIGTTSPGYNFDVNGQVRVQDKLRVGTVNSGNGVVYMSSSAIINPNTTTIVWAQNVSVGMCAFIEYYILNNNSLTDQRAGTIVVTWNQSGTPTIVHTETTTTDIGSTTSINFTSSLVGADARINAVNSSANPYTIVMSYKYF